ncbi:hypothetical protein [Aquimarina litoralis]|uniref:hypothetical protein n=1 Tax=Aquimarina litoralis TaxID=584605 RepID=UPI001C593358|nr:hypothetical protein [Aquimarina litoralis]MBW1296684.1 hypothetical protein [Aquimarina litoralis]
MKNYKYILSLSILLAAFASCDDEDNELNNVVLPPAPTTNVTATITPEFTFATIESDLNFDISVPSGFASDAIIQVESSSPAVTTIEQVRLVDGATTATGSITALDVDAGVGFRPQTVQIAASGVRLVNIEVDEDMEETITPIENDNTALSSEPVTIDIYNRLPAVSAAGDANLLVDWSGAPANDLDFRANLVGVGQVTGQTGTRYEAITLAAGFPDGEFVISVQVFNTTETQTTEDIDYTFFYALPDGTVQIVNGTLPAGSETWDGSGADFDSASIEIGRVVKAGTTYTVTTN